MRSRDGSNTLLCRPCALIFFLVLTLFGSEEYLISYRYVIKDAFLYNESFLLSKAMRKCSGTPQKEITIFNEKHLSLKKLLSDTSGEFIFYLHKLGLDVEHRVIQNNMQNSDTTILTLHTTCFKVDFNEDFVILTPLR